MMRRCLCIMAFCVIAFSSGGAMASSAMTAEVLPLNSSIMVRAPESPLDKNSAPKKLARYYCSSFAPYVKVYVFTVSPGTRYTFYFRHPADGLYRNARLVTETPLTDDLANYTRKGSRGFVIYGQQPWKDPKGHLFRHNFTVSPESDNSSLYMVLECGKPGLSCEVMLKSPADDDNDVKRSSTGCLGTVWSDPLVLSTVPGKSPVNAASPSPAPGAGFTPTTVSTGLTTAALGGTWTVNEAGRWFGTWIRRPGTVIFDCTWKNSSGQVVKDVIRIGALERQRIVLYRHGNGGRYDGILSQDGKRITSGTASWYKKGETWSATISK